MSAPWIGTVNGKQIKLSLSKDHETFILDIHGKKGLRTFLHYPGNMIDSDSGAHLLYDLKLDRFGMPDDIFYVGILGLISEHRAGKAADIAIGNKEFLEFRKQYEHFRLICDQVTKEQPLTREEFRPFLNKILRSAKLSGKRVRDEERAHRIKEARRRKDMEKARKAVHG